MAESMACIGGTCSVAVEQEIQQTVDGTESTVRLHLRHRKPKKRVAWTTDTVDNENMNKRKSKCCCIYEKPHVFGESSSDTDDECDHCRGHVEAKKKPTEEQANPIPKKSSTDVVGGRDPDT